MKKKGKIILLGTLGFLLIGFYFLLPAKLFNSPYSTVVYGQDQRLLGARIATDGQWRFPPKQELPELYKKAVVAFEDKHFYYHPGVDMLAIGRAIIANIKAGRIEQGGSTITMQVIRMAFENQPRTVLQKLKEIGVAVRLEFSFSKEEILALYAAHAPFGGNVVGIEAAAWRYFSRPPDQLSVAEYALLAVLPNSPSLLRPGKNEGALLAKRNKLLLKMYNDSLIKRVDYELAILENLPLNPKPLPNFAPHITQQINMNDRGMALETTLDGDVQIQMNQLLERHHDKLKLNGVHNAALLVVEIETGNVISYVGNTNAGLDHGEYVDVCQAQRSSGSILKPFLYAAMQKNGQLLPQQLVADIPTFLAGFQPENYSREYEGAVPADAALARSLNVPAVRELKEFGVSQFKQELQSVGFTSINRSVENYGLSLILGGAEVTLWEVCGAYLAMGQSVVSENRKIKNRKIHFKDADTASLSPKMNPAAAYLAFKALKTANHSFTNSGVSADKMANVAWKTGTSFGFRDAWAVGVNAKYVVGVWVGNADGEGRPGVIGAEAAAPIMFEAFSSLSVGNEWFLPPYNHMQEIVTCKESGFLASANCTSPTKTWAATGSESAEVCTFHQPIKVTVDKRYRITATCEVDGLGTTVNWFVLPPAWEYYYKKKNAGYALLPPIKPECGQSQWSNPMQLIYPSNFQKLVQAKQLSGEPGPIIFKLAHRDFNKKVYWHANEIYLGETKETHELPVILAPGKYGLKVVDEDGNELYQHFEVL